MNVKMQLRAAGRTAKGNPLAEEGVRLRKTQERNDVPRRYRDRQDSVLAGEKPRVRVVAGRTVGVTE